MADISWTEILIAISISIILIFIGCLVLGLHVQSIKNNMNADKSNIETSIGKIYDENNVAHTGFNYTLNQINSNININSKSNIDMSKQISALSNVGLSNMSTLDAQLKLVNDTIAKLQNGTSNFSKLSIQDSYIKVSNDTMNIGGKNSIFMDTQKLYMNSNSCLLFGSNEICSSSNEFKVNKTMNVTGMKINNMSMSASNNILNIKDDLGNPLQIESSGIIQKSKGSMIDYLGNGMGKFNDGMRIYIPGNVVRNKIALSYFDNNEFTDILSAEKSAIVGDNDTVNIIGDVAIKGYIYNEELANFASQVDQQITNLVNENMLIRQNLLALELKSITSDEQLK